MYVWGKKQGVHVDQSGMWVAVDPCNVFFLLFTFGTLATIENIHYIVITYPIYTSHHQPPLPSYVGIPTFYAYRQPCAYSSNNPNLT